MALQRARTFLIFTHYYFALVVARSPGTSPDPKDDVMQYFNQESDKSVDYSAGDAVVQFEINPADGHFAGQEFQVQFEDLSRDVETDPDDGQIAGQEFQVQFEDLSRDVETDPDDGQIAGQEFQVQSEDLLRDVETDPDDGQFAGQELPVQFEDLSRVVKTHILSPPSKPPQYDKHVASKCLAPVTSKPPTRKPSLPQKHNPGGCSIPASQRVACDTTFNPSQCRMKGCCVDPTTTECFYPVDVCTADKQFVFAVHHDITSIPVDPESLVVVRDRGCQPVIKNREFAIFKFSVSECGTLSYELGDTVVYMTELHTVIKARRLKYGTITRVNPVSLDNSRHTANCCFKLKPEILSRQIIVECRYSKKKHLDKSTMISVGYMVLSPSLPPSVTAEGRFGVQLRIAEDETFTKFLPQYHQPLHSLLGRSLYLEIRLKSPKPVASLIVDYCVAYTRTANKALILLHEGCPNPIDSGSVSILYVKDSSQNRHQNSHQHRFEVKAFQFMEERTNKYLNEEIYFMCSAEVCMPSSTPCRRTCFDSKGTGYGISP